jgi:hypothetical protein
VDIVERVITTDPNAKDFIFHPYHEYRDNPSTGKRERVYREFPSADTFIEEHQRLQQSPRIEGCNLERVMLALQFWSDGTRLAQFGSHKLWPIYMTFANQLLDQRMDPACNAWHDIAHIQEVGSLHYRSHYA